MSFSASPHSHPHDLPDMPVELEYRYIFDADEAEAAVRCVEDHGFAVMREVIDEELQRELQESVRQACDPHGTLPRGQSANHLRFVEVSDALLKLFDNAAWLEVQRQVYGGLDDLTVHRSACILRNPGSDGISWHTDYFCEGESPTSPNAILNRGQARISQWFYLTGCYPSHGGLLLIPDSHHPDWPAPEGFRFINGGKRLARIDGPEEPFGGMGIPGAIPLIAGGRDLLLFHERTYHAAGTNHEDKQRLSCGVVFRKGREPFPVPWPLPEEAKLLKQRLRDDLKPYFEHYVSVLREREY